MQIIIIIIIYETFYFKTNSSLYWTKFNDY